MYTFLGIILLFVLGVGFIIAQSSKPSKKVVEKYGQPIAHFSTTKCWNGLPMRGLSAQAIDMDFYSGFVVVSGFDEEIILTKESKNVGLYGGLFNPVFEVQLSNTVAQCSVTYKQRNLIKDFLDIY